MDPLVLLFPMALASLGGVLTVAFLRPVLARMAWRNTLRRPRQSVLIVLGLLVGTALVSASLVSGDSMEYAIVEATYDAFQETDESVFLDGYHFFPAVVARDLAQDGPLSERTDAVGANILWDTAATNARSQQYEPLVGLAGFDPAADRPFGPFRRGPETFWGDELGPNDVVLNQDAARKLQAREGDTLQLNFTLALDPVLPRVQQHEGVINVSVRPPPLPIPNPAPDAGADDWVATFRIDGTVVSLFLAVHWDPNATADLDLEVTSPSGRTRANHTGTDLPPDQRQGSAAQTWINYTQTLAQPLETGQWTLRVTSNRSVQTPFVVTRVQLEPFFNLTKYQARLQEVRQDPFFKRFTDFDPSNLDELLPRQSRDVRVAWVYETGKGPNFKLPNSLMMFLRLDTLQGWLNRPGEINWVKVSNRGGVEEGAARTPEVYPDLLNGALDRVKERHPDHPAILELKAFNDKEFWLDQAQELGQIFSIFLTSIASFSILAGLLLIINIFTMLAEERKVELGISRAVGLQRRHLTRLFTLEGAYYALPAALLGTFAGLLLAYGLITGFNVFGDPQTFPRIPYRLETSSLLTAFATGILLTLGTVYVGARRVSRLNIVRSIRSLEEPERRRSLVGLGSALAVAAAGAALTTLAYVPRQAFALQVVSPAVLAVGAALLLRQWFRRRHVYVPVALTLFTYYVFTLFLIKKYDTVEGNVFGPLRAVLMTVCIVVVIVHVEAPLRWLGRALGALRPLRAAAPVATSYPLQRKFRAGMTLTMFAVILLVVSLFSIFGALFTPDPDKEAGGYDIEARTSAPLDTLEIGGTRRPVLDRFEFYDLVPYFVQFGGLLVRVDNETTGQFGPPLDYVFGVDETFAGRNDFALLRRDPSYGADRDAWNALAEGEGVAIVGYSYSTDRHGNEDAHRVGDALQVDAKGGIREFRIIGITEQFHFKGVFIRESALREMYSNTDTLVLAKLGRGAPGAEEVAVEFEGAYRDVGLDASSIHAQVAQESQQFRQVFTLIQLFLSLGLVVGILSLGIVTARSVIERRQEIGMLRAVGYLRRDIRRAFLLETMTMVGLGVLVGSLLAVLVSFGLWVAIVKELNIPFMVPWTDLAVIASIAFVATLVATLAPIVRASRIPPAEALRYIE